VNFPKGLILSFLGFLLFLSLSLFGLTFTLNNTILNPDFITSELDSLDISSLAEEFLGEEVSSQGEFILDYLDDVIADFEPWIKEQANAVIEPSYDYFLGESESLSVVISLESVKESLEATLKEAILQSPPPELAGLSPSEIEQHFDEVYQEISQQIPSTFELSQSSLSPEVLATLEQVRQYIGYVQLAYTALIGLILLLIAGIILINRQITKTARSIGITFLTCGGFGYGGIFAAKHFAPQQLSQFQIPSSLQAWIPQLLDDILAPLEMFSIGLLMCGIALTVVSFVYKRQSSF